MNTCAFLFSFLAGLSTLLGMIPIFFCKEEKQILPKSLAFASGVMISVSIIDLIPEALKIMPENFSSILFVMIFFVIGVITSFLLDKIGEKGTLYHVGMISMLAIIMHNIPEGIVTYLTTTANTSLGIRMSLAIAFHNIPEGISIFFPIYFSKKNFKLAFIYTLISGLSEPLGAILSWLFLESLITPVLLGLLYAFTAGIMCSISYYELLPISISYEKKKETNIYFILGCIIMLISHLHL